MNPKQTALVIIDMQNDVLRYIVPTGVAVVPALQQALEGSRSRGVHVVHCLRVHRADGVDVEKFRLNGFRERPFLVRNSDGARVIPELEPLEAELQVTKSRFSGFFQTDMLMVLTRLGVTTLAVCGVQTPNCVRGTVVDGLAYDFDVVLLDDAIAAQTPEIHRANMLDMEHMGAKVATVRSFLDLLT